jgi:hypothetical protein
MEAESPYFNHRQTSGINSYADYQDVNQDEEGKDQMLNGLSEDSQGG